MLKTFSELLGTALETLQHAMPLITIIIFYQMTVLQIPVQDILGMLGWILFITLGLILAL